MASKSALRKRESRSLQVWPGGASFTYRGDPDGPADQKELKRGYGHEAKDWRPGTPEEWRQIRIELRAELYGERDILGCDSSLVGDLIRAANSGELSPGDLAEGFEYDNMRGIYADPSDWTIEQCRDWLEDHGINPIDLERREDAIETWQAAVRDRASDYPAEVYEWWRVSSWLCDQLAAIGEVTIDNGYGHWWGRTCTGQGWIMDGTLQQVAAQFEHLLTENPSC